MAADRSVIISGGGPAGLVAALLLAQQQLNVTLIARPPVAGDTRTIALMQPAIKLLQYIDVWPELASRCAPLKQLHVVDDTGGVGGMLSAPPLKFKSEELGLAEFGFNVPLALLMPVLWQHIEQRGIRRIEAHSASAVAGSGEIVITIDNGESLAAQALLIADGANSPLRATLGFNANIARYEQTAMATSFGHSAPHDGVSTEWHKKDGPFTTVPMPGARSSLVWMGRPDRIEALMALPDSALATEIQLESHGALGRISDLGPRNAFPMQTLDVAPMAQHRAFLIGEAGHAMPPIGAQGLNLSLRDVAALADLMTDASDIGAPEVCTTYDKARHGDVGLRLLATGMANRSLLSAFAPAHLARIAGLSAINALPPLRQFALKAGLGPLSALPSSMR